MSQLPRFVIASDAISSGAVCLTGPELHHLRDVMRIRPGSEVALLDEDNIEYVGRVERLEADQAIVTLRDAPSRIARETSRLILGAGIIKGPRMDALVEHAAELGATELVTLICARSVAHEPGAQRLERWRRIATAAAKQSFAPHRMALRGPIMVAELVRIVPSETLAVVCEADAPLLGAVLRAALVRETRPRAILLACGPEGGFDPVELALMRGAGFHIASLGPNRLRSATAALAALSIAAATIQELPGSN
jgi:16S rRNA (uracil1498-N3)-methyltransferase